jgi:hypothetical protein
MQLHAFFTFTLCTCRAWICTAILGLEGGDWAVVCSVVDRGNINSAHHDMPAAYIIVILLYILL